MIFWQKWISFRAEFKPKLHLWWWMGKRVFFWIANLGPFHTNRTPHQREIDFCFISSGIKMVLLLFLFMWPHGKNNCPPLHLHVIIELTHPAQDLTHIILGGIQLMQFAWIIYIHTKMQVHLLCPWVNFTSFPVFFIIFYFPLWLWALSLLVSYVG